MRKALIDHWTQSRSKPVFLVEIELKPNLMLIAECCHCFHAAPKSENAAVMTHLLNSDSKVELHKSIVNIFNPHKIQT